MRSHVVKESGRTHNRTSHDHDLPDTESPSKSCKGLSVCRSASAYARVARSQEIKQSSGGDRRQPWLSTLTQVRKGAAPD
ncbi:hypothetical protein Pmani_027059 [Petrolisthes manimaculis]|uniref:Uncharacterized protein n=1 Tax=Petrolisthes manimaculis TaxID=1843537 RepID=A0AAE1P4M3_9EUCA|nr:hypothetical protein Pmani_027059 [Petrolisthes manimaculis]